MRVLYHEGDACARKYIEGALRSLAIPFVRGERAARRDRFDLCVLSDVTRKRLGRRAERAVLKQVEDGAGLLMVGGWTSFGRGGWAGSELVARLPVLVRDGDDRLNLPSGATLEPLRPHPMLEGLSFDPPPIITGYNRVRPRRGAQVVLGARRVEGVDERSLRLSVRRDPILVLSGSQGPARAAALATDLAPHWSGGWTDWGPHAVDVGHGEELGTHYLRLLQGMVEWLAGPSHASPRRTGSPRTAAGRRTGMRRRSGRVRTEARARA